MKSETKVFETEVIIRFPDCDPFNHLNNGRYIDYFMNAREDHLMKFMDFNLYKYAKDNGVAWVVSQNQIAYLRPALLMETVVIQTTLISMNQRGVRVEMRMWNKDKTSLKSLLWADFVHINLQTQRSIAHSESLDHFFSIFLNQLPGEHATFDERLVFLRSKTALELDHPFSVFIGPEQYRLAIAV